jgi:hypothetical protein
VAGFEAHRYSPFLGPGDHFWQSYEENQVQKVRHTIHHTILEQRNRYLCQDFYFSRIYIIVTRYGTVRFITLYDGLYFGFYIVKSAMRLINSGNLHIKKQHAVWIYAPALFLPFFF